MRNIVYGVFSILTVMISDVQAGDAPITGRFQGTGRACYGTLDIRREKISWITSFSKCSPAGYKLIEKNRTNKIIEETYSISDHSKSCRYAIIKLTHISPSKNVGWEVTGYSSEKAYQKDKSSGYKTKSEEILSCYLVRESDN